jgi:hypothetical protein
VVPGFDIAGPLPRATSALVRLVALVALAGVLFGLVCVAVIGGAYVAVLNLAH